MYRRGGGGEVGFIQSHSVILTTPCDCLLAAEASLITEWNWLLDRLLD